MNNDQFEQYSDISAELFEQIDPTTRITDKKRLGEIIAEL